MWGDLTARVNRASLGGMRSDAVLMILPTLAAGAAAAQGMAPVRDLGGYLQSGASAAFVASGVGLLEDCRSAIGFFDARTATTATLEARCAGEDEPQIARMTFVIVRAGLPRPMLVPYRLELLP